MKCNIMMTSFVKKTLKKAHSHLVDRLVIKAQIVDAAESNRRINDKTLVSQNTFGGSQASTAYSPASDYGDSESMIEEVRDQRYYGNHAPQIPPIQHSPSFSFRGPGDKEFRDKTSYDESLYPRALSVRSSTASYNGSLNGGESVHGSQHGRQSYQEPNQRVSWQNLNPNAGRTPPPQFSEPELREQPAQYRSSAHSFHAELESTERLPQSTYAPAHYGAAELE